MKKKKAEVSDSNNYNILLFVNQKNYEEAQIATPERQLFCTEIVAVSYGVDASLFI